MPYCIHCGTQYTNTDRFCMHCGKALPASARPALPPRSKPSTGSPKKVRTVVYSLTGLVILLGIFSIIAGNIKEPVKESKKKKYSDYYSDTVVADSTTTVAPAMPMDTAQIEMDIVKPPDVVPADTLTTEPDKPAPSYVDPAFNKLVYTSPCFVIITGFYASEDMAIKETYKLIRKGYKGAYVEAGKFPVLNNSRYYATVVGPYETSSECWDGLRSLRRIGPHWYGVKLTYDPSDRVELKPY